jgi:hypothetical protein
MIDETDGTAIVQVSGTAVVAPKLTIAVGTEILGVQMMVYGRGRGLMNQMITT